MKFFSIIIFSFSIQSFSNEYCVFDVDFTAPRKVEIVKTCNGVRTDLFKSGKVTPNFYLVNQLLSSYPLDDVQRKVESFTALKILEMGFQIKERERKNANGDLEFITIK